MLVIHAVKDVAAALASLIHATKNASGKSFNDPAMTHLKDAAKVTHQHHPFEYLCIVVSAVLQNSHISQKISKPQLLFLMFFRAKKKVVKGKLV